MSIAYVDTSILVAIEFKESNAKEYAKHIGQYSKIISSNFLEAEYRSVCRREHRVPSLRILSEIDWIFPKNSLTNEIESVLKAGYLRGADLWNVASALYAVTELTGVSFNTLDAKQSSVAASLGFQVWPEFS